MTDVYLYEAIGLLLSIFLFYSLVVHSVKQSKYRKFLIASFFGMGVLLFHSISGIPKNNFDPLVGDTFKPLYYSFVLVFSFAILIAVKLSEKYKRFFHLVIYCLLIIFILGFPKNIDFEPNVNMTQKIQSSLFCPVEKIIYFDSDELDSFKCGIENLSNKIGVENNKYLNNIEHKPFNLLFIFLNLVSALLIAFQNTLSKNRRFAFIF